MLQTAKSTASIKQVRHKQVKARATAAATNKQMPEPKLKQEREAYMAKLGNDHTAYIARLYKRNFLSAHANMADKLPAGADLKVQKPTDSAINRKRSEKGWTRMEMFVWAPCKSAKINITGTVFEHVSVDGWLLADAWGRWIPDGVAKKLWFWKPTNPDDMERFNKRMAALTQAIEEGHAIVFAGRLIGGGRRGDDSAQLQYTHHLQFIEPINIPPVMQPLFEKDPIV